MSKNSRAREAAKTTNRVVPPIGPNVFVVNGRVLLAGSIVALAALAVYLNSFSGPFILDDAWSITTNPSIHRFGTAFSPPPDKGVGGRPLLNLTFAVNYALSGLSVGSYHVFNLLIHALAGLTLFGIVRRTLLEPPTPTSDHSIVQQPIFRKDATWLALAVAVIWMVHPLQTEAVTYISQRAESLMGLFYLLTLYCFVRSAERRSREPRVQSQEPDPSVAGIGSQRSTLSSRLGSSASGICPLSSALWLLASVVSCLLGMMSKEVIVTAPVMVFLYDRTFVAGTFRDAWRLRWRYYLGLACTWLWLAHSLMSLGQRNSGYEKVTWWSYALTSCRSVVLYLKMTFWPHPLVFDYGAKIVHHAVEAMPYALVLLVLLAAVVTALRYRPAIGFAGAWFFVILAPTSSVVPVADQPMAEHRLYLSLAAVVAVVVLGFYRWSGRRSLVICAAVAAGLGWLSAQRNEVYGSALAIWGDTVAKCPDNARARYNFGNALLDTPGRMSDALAQFDAAVRFHPDSPLAHYNFGNALHTAGQIPEAIRQYEEAIRLDPNDAQAHNNLGGALVISRPSRVAEAMEHYQAAIRINPGYAEAHYNLGAALSGLPGRLSEAISEYQAAVRYNPDYAEAHMNLGYALLQSPGHEPEAMTELEAALRLRPDLTQVRQTLDRLRSYPPH